MKVLSTKIISEDDMTTAVRLGFEIEAFSFISTIPIREDNLRSRLELLQHKQLVVIFTSEQSVICTASFLTAPPANWSIICISGATKTAVIKWLGVSSIIFSGINAAEISGHLSSMSPQEILFICGNRRLDIIPEALCRSGHIYEELVVYRTQLMPVSLTQSYDAYLFYSPSGVQSFFLSNTLPACSVNVAIGESTAAALKEYKINNILTAAAPQVSAMLQTLKSYETSK